MNIQEFKKSFYELKKINFFGRKLCIILQNENGPCPLIAIANILLLRNKLNINLDYSQISSEDLIQLIAEILMDSNTELRESKELKADFEKNINDAISFLPKMQSGLQVNIKFKDIKNFEYTPELIIFDLLGIDLVHGWIVDPAQREYFPLISTLSYNQLLEKIISMSLILEKPSNIKKIDSPYLNNLKRENIKKEDEEKIIMEGEICQRFLDETASQLTYFGLYELHKNLKENQLCIIFRNNHFGTLFKHKNELFILLTDSGYKNIPIVWEKLDQVDNDTIFYTSEFQPYQEIEISKNDINNISNSLSEMFSSNSPELIKEEEKLTQSDLDRKLAMKIYEQEIITNQINIEQQYQQQKQKKKKKKERKRFMYFIINTLVIFV
jgi:hypothetical protein